MTPSTPAANPTEAQPQSLVTALAIITERLNSLVDSETQILTKPVLTDISAIGREKSVLAARYEMLTRELQKRPLSDLKADPDARRLAEALTRLSKLAQANAQAIQIHIQANQRILDSVARAARDASMPRFSYGTTRMGYGLRGGQRPAVAINRVL